ncbi:hypothetical protein Q5P01_001087 [Channa striata]|uniref:Uncharacterized protein n=1 Tax=Channa striata TaxID=64152 RepID=A0AA88NNY2_CHASR|nr:hypothetical protein Q5P01_001087 [Channa striata]
MWMQQIKAGTRIHLSPRTVAQCGAFPGLSRGKQFPPRDEASLALAPHLFTCELSPMFSVNTSDGGASVWESTSPSLDLLSEGRIQVDPGGSSSRIQRMKEREQEAQFFVSQCWEFSITPSAPSGCWRRASAWTDTAVLLALPDLCPKENLKGCSLPWSLSRCSSLLQSLHSIDQSAMFTAGPATSWMFRKFYTFHRGTFLAEGEE